MISFLVNNFPPSSPTSFAVYCALLCCDDHHLWTPIPCPNRTASGFDSFPTEPQTVVKCDAYLLAGCTVPVLLVAYSVWLWHMSSMEVVSFADRMIALGTYLSVPGFPMTCAALALRHICKVTSTLNTHIMYVCSIKTLFMLRIRGFVSLYLSGCSGSGTPRALHAVSRCLFRGVDSRQRVMMSSS